MAAFVLAEFLPRNTGVGITVLAAGPRVVRFAGGIFPAAHIAHTVLRFGATYQPRLTNAFLKVRIIIRAVIN